MTAFVKPEDITVHASRTITQEGYSNLEDILDNGGSVEDYFEYADDWEVDDADEMRIEIEVLGVVPETQLKRDKEYLVKQKETLAKEINKFTEMIKEKDDIIEKLENQIIDMNPTKAVYKGKVKGEEE